MEIVTIFASDGTEVRKYENVTSSKLTYSNNLDFTNNKGKNVHVVGNFMAIIEEV